MEKGKLFTYSVDDLIEKPVEWEECGKCLSAFDKQLRNAWDKAVKDGLFRYSLDDLVYKKLNLQQNEDFPVPCVAQLNPQRAVNRRKRECFESMNDDFDEKQFNFTKIARQEILMEVCLKSDDKVITKEKTEILLNISPIEYGHILIATNLSDCLPQKLTVKSLQIAFDILQLSSQPGFRLGFNSLHAWASINHLHFHGMYCDHEIFGDILPAEYHLSSSCALINIASPLPAFVFVVPDGNKGRRKIAEYVVKVTDYLHQTSTPYNILLNRGKLLRKDGTQSDKWTTRALVFPRKSSKKLQPAEPFDVACIEVGGHFPVKAKASFEDLTNTKVSNCLKEAALEEDVFNDIVQYVKILLRG
uniref:GDP-D-glucose phosphorylase 1-like isoform X1 n=1 Tax=Styela clava TaxID=7725 RepID=UPI001939A1F9|nr:GDP-D-glucose phosphorylase 1-like isoform X1 [Styela clava]